MYLLDANIFIQSHRRHYGLDFVPAFWEWLERGHLAGVLCSLDCIKAELQVGKDELSTWATGHGPIFLSMDAATQPSLARLAAWATAPASGYTQAAIAEFLSSADYELVAFADAHGHTVVTYEVSAPGAKRRVKIPEACAAMGVQWTDPYRMLRAESVRFVLDA